MSRKGENIRKRKDGRWEGRYTEHTADGRKVRSIYAHSYTEARRKLTAAKAAYLQSAENGKAAFTAAERTVTVEKAAAAWLAEVRVTKKYSTYMKYLSVYESHIQKELGKTRIVQFSSDCVKKALKSDHSDSIRKSIYCVLNHILSYSSIHYHTPMFPLKQEISPKKREPVKILNSSEQKKLLCFLYQNMDPAKLGILICLSTGLRLGEISSLKWSDIDLENGMLRVNRTVSRCRTEQGSKKTMLMETAPKTACSRREIPIPDALLQQLSLFRQSRGEYLVNGEKPMDPRTYQNKFKSYLKEAGIENTHFHVLRHTFATNCISSGADVKSVSEMLGHASVRITLDRYVHPAMETKRAYLNSLSSIYGQYAGQTVPNDL